MSKDSRESKSTKLGHYIEKVLIENLFKNIEDRVDTICSIEAVFNTRVVTVQKSRENKTTTDFLVGIKNENNAEEINSIKCKTRCVSRTEE